MAEPSPAPGAIAVYVVDRPALSAPDTGPLFPWLADARARRAMLDGLLGPHDPEAVQVMIDPYPAGAAWAELIAGLTEERFHTVVTHLAPLTSAQRQQLIGICAICGVQLVTPGNAIGASQPMPRQSQPADASGG